MDVRRTGKLHLLIAAALAVTTSAPDAGAAKVKVRGSTRIVASTLRGRVVPAPSGAAQRSLFVRGTVEDDVGGRLAGQRIEISAVAGDGTRVRFADGAAATICAVERAPLPRAGDAIVTTTTDEAGSFCARLVLPAERYLLNLATAGTPFLDAATTQVAADLARRSVALRVDGGPRRLSLDADEHTVVATALFEDEDDPSVPAKLLPLTLTNDQGIVLGTEVTDALGKATFRVPSRTLGEPGLGALIASFPGDEQTGGASASATIEKTARVSLTLAQPIEPVEAPEDGVPLVVSLSSRLGATPAGAIEARLGDKLVGAAPVTPTSKGRAAFTATFSAPDRSEVALTLRFAPEAPWWEAPEGLGVSIPLTSASPWRRVPLLAAALAVAAFLAAGRLSRSRGEPQAPKSQRAPRSEGPTAGIAVVEASRDGRGGWRGVIVDAHERTPIAGTRVAIESHDFQGTRVLASAFGDDNGAFELPPARALGRAELVVDAPLHASLRRALPPSGVLEIGLVSRKRALLDRLVEWARVRGRPFDAKPEPTPAHVKQVATPGSPTRRWAGAVESAAFGPELVDGRIEAEIDALRPDDRPEPPAVAAAGEGQQTKEQDGKASRTVPR